MLQLDLFADLPIPPGACQWKRASTHHPSASETILAAEQLAFNFRLRTLVCDRDDAFDYPRHDVVSASAAAAPETTAPRSIFDFAAAFTKIKARARFASSDGFRTTSAATANPVNRVEIELGVTRHVGAAYPARWTSEDEERERQRRARQRPPRPTRKAKTRGRKLLDLIGGDDSENDDGA